MYLDGRNFLLFFGIWVKGYHLKVSTNGLFMFYVRTLPIADVAKIIVGYHCVDFIDREGDYGVYL